MQTDTIVEELHSYYLGDAPGVPGAITDINSVTINGKTMMKMSLTANQGEQIQITGYVTTYKGKMYTFVLSSDKASHNSMMPYLDAVVNSAKFL